MFDCIRIVLARPIRSGNVGAAARAMANMGLSDLVLVAPQCDPNDEQARGFAARARPLLETARIAPDLRTALTGCVLSFATSGKGGLYRRSAAVCPHDAARHALATAATGPVAIVFGPEDRGLVLEELLDFDRVIEIPSDPAYPALNLGAAVMVMCYELRRAWNEMQPTPPPGAAPPPARPPLADDTQKRVMFERLFESLERIGFFHGQQSPEHLRFALRHLLGRADLSVNEADILIGLARQIGWFADDPQRWRRTADRESETGDTPAR